MAKYRIVQEREDHPEYSKVKFYPEWRPAFWPFWLRFYRNSVAPATWFGSEYRAQEYLDQRAAGIDPDAVFYSRQAKPYNPSAKDLTP